MRVAFIGHRKVSDKDSVVAALERIVTELIEKENADTFMFGSKSKFNDICYETVTRLKEKYPHIIRVYVRSEYEFIDEQYENYLLTEYEETYYPKEVSGAGAKSYVVRNYVMVDKSDCIVFYYDSNCLPRGRKSGTKMAYDYAAKKRKRIINVAAP